MNRLAQISLTFLALLPASPYNYGQDKAAPFWPARTADELVVTPSPEVGQLLSYKNSEINLSSGQGSIQETLFEWSVGEYKIEIGLNYRIGAFKTHELPGWLGLGWSLIGTGSVSRSIIGQPDEKLMFDLRSTSQINGSLEGVRYIEDLMNYKKEASLDRYSYYFPGGSGQFVISEGDIIELPKTNNKIEFIGKMSDGVRDFRVTTPDGTKYEFTEREKVTYQDIPTGIDGSYHPHDYTAVSAWMLTRIILPGSADTIRYEYSRMPSWERIKNFFTNSVGVYIITPSGSDWITNSNSSVVVPQTTCFENPSILQRIVSRNAIVTFQHDSITGERYRQSTKWISGMSLCSPDGDEIKRISLRYDPDRRRKLSKITIHSSDGTLLSQSEYFYHKDTGKQLGDLFNYSNASLDDKSADVASAFDLSSGKINPRRDFNFTNALCGTIDRWISSGGVETKFIYEPNSPAAAGPLNARRKSNIGIDSIVTGIVEPPLDLSDPIEGGDDENDDYDPSAPYTGAFIPRDIPVGIRIRSIVTTDRSTGRKQIREYGYNKGMYNILLSYVGHQEYISMSGKSIHDVTIVPDRVAKRYTVSTALSSSRMPGYSVEGTSVFYGEVTETISGTGIDTPIKNIYKFDTSRCKLKYLSAVRTMQTELDLRWRSLAIPDGFIPFGRPLFYHRMLGPNTVRGYFREHIGAEPELIETENYEFHNGEYRLLNRERRFYSTVDSVCIAADVFHEPLVRRFYHTESVFLRYDFEDTRDINAFNVDVEASSRLLDSISVTRFFHDGSQRTRVESYCYSGPEKLPDEPTGKIGIHLPLDSLPIISGGSGLQIFPSGNDSPFSGDTICNYTSLRLPVSVTVREGGHKLEHHTAYSSMVATMGFFSHEASSGLRTLPVREMWIMDGCDTLHRQYDYGNFTGSGGALMTLPISVTTSLSRSGGAADTVDVQRVHSYTPCGRPTLVSQTGKPLAAYTWGYGGDLIKSISIMENDFGRNDGKRSKAVTGPPLDWDGSVADRAETLRSDFEWRPLVGCSQIRLPSGKTSKFDYHGGRLHRVCDGLGRLLTQYDYVFYDASTERFAGCNRISTTSFLFDSPQGSTSTKILDGFSLPVAEIAEESGASGEDVASVSRYDALGRPVARWMPLALDENAIAEAMKRDTPLKKAATEQFADAGAFSRIEYPDRLGTAECSATLGGSDFADHPQLSEQTCSNPSDAARRVVRWIWDGETLSASGFYAAGELDAVMTEDGDGRRTWTFTDCLGRQVLSRSATEQPDRYADTYTVSDPWGNPLLVLPPEASERLGRSGTLTLSSGAVTELLDGYAFIYSYDSRLRLRSKKLPGCEPVRYAYDTENRLIFSRDGNQALQGRRSFMLYDGYGRMCLTGTCRDALSEDFWSAGASGLPATAINPMDLINPINGSSILNFPDTSGDYADARLLTATFFDDYSFLSAMGQNLQAEPRPSGAIAGPRGLPTGSLTAVLGRDGASDSIAPLLSVSYYDREERVIGTATLSHRGDLLSSATTYTRGGLPTDVTSSLQPSGSTSKRTITTTNNYDRHGRILTTQLSLGESAPVTVASCGYNRHGRLQRTDYHGGLWRNSSYDMHGWPTGWHCGYLGQQLLYAGGTSPSYTGRVSTKITNSYGHYDSYAYRYDRLGRLTEAAFSRRMPEGATAENGSPDADFSTTFSYDLQGNILSLTRHGLKAPGVYGEIDDITAGYSGNRLTTLRDAAATVLLESSLDLQEGSWTGSDFAYDANGNQTRDMSRGVANVEYNELNLPRRVEFAGGGRIDYLYSAAGTKLGERVYDGEGVEICRRDYAGVFEFEGDTLERMLVPEGFVTASDSTLHIFIPDYQGNITGVYNSACNCLEQFTDYYPYGLPHASATSPSVNRRKYGGKELTTDCGLNLCDFSARWHNPAFPAFTTPDPMADTYTPLSPYTYCGGDPINQIDPTGKVVVAATNLEQDAILITLRKEDRQYIEFDTNGVLNIDLIKSHKSNSENYNILSFLSSSQKNIEVIFTDNYTYRDNNGEIITATLGDIEYDDFFKEKNPISPTGPTTGETGKTGITLLPETGESGINSPDEKIYVVINNGLSPFGAAQAFSHEAYGHAFIYLQTGSRSAAAHNFILGGKDGNIKLIQRITESILETIKNNE